MYSIVHNVQLITGVTNLSSDFKCFSDPNLLEKGGLFHVSSPRGGSTRFALSCLNLFLETVDPPLSPCRAHYLWIADEGFLYPVALPFHCRTPVSRWLLVKARDPTETWKIALEAIQTGLFGFVFLRPSRSCDATHLRRLQLSSERTQTRIFLLGNLRFPHWVIKHSFEVINP